MTRRFLEAVQGGGSIEDLVAGLSPDVVLITDGGGLKQAALRPIRGVDKVMRFYAGVMTKPDAPTRWRAVDVNGQAGIGAFTPTARWTRWPCSTSTDRWYVRST